MRFLGDRVVQRIGALPVAVGGALLAFGGILLVMFAPADVLLYVGFFAIGIGSANIVPVFFSLMGRQDVMPVSAAVSAVSTMGYLGILAGPAAIGFVSLTHDPCRRPCHARCAQHPAGKRSGSMYSNAFRDFLGESLIK